MAERTTPPPSYPPKVTYRQAELWTISGLTEQPRMPGELTPRTDTPQIRRIVDRFVIIPEHREQLKAWARAKAYPGDQDCSFSRSCTNRGWSESTAKRNVEKAIGMVFMILNLPDQAAA